MCRSIAAQTIWLIWGAIHLIKGIKCGIAVSLSLSLSAASSYELVQIANIYKDGISYFIHKSQLELVRTCTNYNLLIQPNTKF